MPITQLIGAVQNYAWGDLGSDSFVIKAHLANLGEGGGGPSSSFEVKENEPYAELWYGNHPNGKCFVKSNSEDQSLQPISTFLENAQQELSFLFKVLSIRLPLSLQLHPDGNNAKLLHKKKPEIYKDPHDKPEMMIALESNVEAFCGFRSKEKLLKVAESVPEFKNELLISNYNSSSEEEILHGIMDNLFNKLAKDEKKLKELIDSILQRANDNTYEDFAIFKRLHKAFPYDVGVFAAFFLNYVKMKKGEAMFLAPNTIHAYIHGRCLECMKCSDNVIRAGLTPKFKDVQELLHLVQYQKLDDPIIAPKTDQQNLKYWPVKTDSFKIHLVQMTTDILEIDLGGKPSLIFSLTGAAQINSKWESAAGGKTFLAVKEEKLTLEILSRTNNDNDFFDINEDAKTKKILFSCLLIN